jgi:hypothetical protein
MHVNGRPVATDVPFRQEAATSAVLGPQVRSAPRELRLETPIAVRDLKIAGQRVTRHGSREGRMPCPERRGLGDAVGSDGGLG